MTKIIGVDSAEQQSAQRIKASHYSAPTESRLDERPSNNDGQAESVDNLVKRAWWFSQFNLMLMVFGLLGIAVLMFIALTPSPETSLADTTSDHTGSNGLTTINKQVSPWSEASRAQARTDAQEILSNLLDSKKFLEEKEVKNWAPLEFTQALLLAEQGDEFYQQQEFQQALDIYQAAVDKLDKLYEQIPFYVRAKIAEGQLAIDEGKSQLAAAAYNAVLTIEPTNIVAMDGLGRAEILDQVLQLSQAADVDRQLFLEQDGEKFLLLAQQKLDQALSLDGDSQDIKTQQESLSRLRQDKQYRDAMTAGFNALFSNKYTTANNAFAAALKINPDDQTASLAYQQSLASNKTSSLQSLLNSAKNFETSEDWQNALSNYQAVLSRDSNQVQAKLGQIRSNARYQLDTQLREALSDPLNLSKSAQKEQAQELLADAKGIRSAGSKLISQIQQLQTALEQTNTTINVQITSDAMTEITLSKEGASHIQLGQFSNKNLALKPGRYVLRGVRLGYRDVRKEIELQPGNADRHLFELQCDQPISGNVEERSNGPA